MKTRYRLMTAVLTGLLLVACASGVRVASDYDPRTGFDYRTFAWHEPSRQLAPDAYVSELVIERIRQAVTDQLQLKGMQTAAAETAELHVRTHLVVEEKFDVQTWDTGYGYHHYPWGLRGNTETVVTRYRQGTLIIDLVDAQSKRLVWRGTAESRIRNYKTPQEREQRVREVVAAVLAQYPPVR